MPLGEAPILSIVIPTKNRNTYLAKLIRALLKFESYDFDIVVHDNSDSNRGFQESCGQIVDVRLKYFFDPKPMPISENCERAVSLATGTFICMIGDDDGVVETILELSRWMKSAGVDAAFCPVSTYLWPGVASVLDGAQSAGILRLPRYSGRVQMRDESKELYSTLRGGGFRIGELPRVYQGVVSKKALDKLKSLAGSYFPGPSPDMANAVALSAVITQFAKVDLPIIISGVCPSSGAAEGANHRHHGEISSRSILAPDAASSWPPEVPSYFSGPTLLAASLISALQATGRQALLSKVRLDRLYAACWVFTPKYRSRTAETRARNRRSATVFAFILSVCWVWCLRVSAALSNLTQKLDGTVRKHRRVVGVSDIGQVIAFITKRYKRDRCKSVFESS